MTRTRSRRRKSPLLSTISGSCPPISIDSNGTRCRTDASVEQSDPAPVDDRHSRQRASCGNQHVDDVLIGNADHDEMKPECHTKTSCPHPHRHHAQVRMHGKDGSSPRKRPASKLQFSEDAKPLSKPQEYTLYMAARAKELKEEGNRLFQKKEYVCAMDQYELALKLIPLDHPDRAIFHSNRAACLMQMKPVQYEVAIRECNLALEAHPGFPRALLRRARAFEATGKLELALEDIELLLEGDVSHPDAVEMARRVRMSLENAPDKVQQDGIGKLPTPIHPGDVKVHVEMVDYPKADSREAPVLSVSACEERTEGNSYMEDDSDRVITPIPCPCPSCNIQSHPKPFQQQNDEASLHSPHCEISHMIHLVDLPSPCDTSSYDPHKMESMKKVIHQDTIQILKMDGQFCNTRPLKIIYDHDIRLAEMPAYSTFGNLRKIVRERFPSSKSVLIKYKDVEGDLVTITSTHDLRLAEEAAAVEAASRSVCMRSTDIFPEAQQEGSVLGLPVIPSALDQLRLYVVEVPAGQEPHDKEEIAMVNDEGFVVSGDGAEKPRDIGCNFMPKEEAKPNGVEELNKWVLDFAQLFKTYLGIDPNVLIDLLEGGMELCVRALEESASNEEASKHFSVASFKFQEMVAIGFLNWGNVYMCAARKQLANDESKDSQMDFCDRLQAAFKWAQAQYAVAEQKFVESIHVKPDFLDAMLSLGQKDFESAKLHWSLAIAKQIDLNSWDSSEMLELFQRAEKTMEKAAALLQKQRHSINDIAACATWMEDAGKPERNGDDGDQIKLSFGQDVAIKSQVYLLWGNILYEHSQIAFRLGLPPWKQLLETALEKFEAAGASPLDVSMALQKHLSTSTVLFDAHEKANYEKCKIVGSVQVAQLGRAADFLAVEDGEDWKPMPMDDSRYEGEIIHEDNGISRNASLFNQRFDDGLSC